MDIELLRSETRGCGDKIFLNSAGSSLVPAVVADSMIGYLRQEELTGGYALANQYESEIQDLYTQAAILLNCAPENIAFTVSATDAYARALSSIPFNKGDIILTTDDDYISNQFAFLSLKNRFGLEVIRAANLADGDLDLAAFDLLMKQHQPRLVALTHLPTNSGLVQQAAEVGQICRKYDVLYLLDACQSVGQMVVDVQQIGCDFLTVTGRKFLRGPRGTGLLYVSDKVLKQGLVPMIFDMQGGRWTGEDSYELTGTAKRFEFFESSAAGRLGMREALSYLNGIGIAEVEKYNSAMMKQFRDMLQQVKGLQLHDKGTSLSNILTFTTTNRGLGDTAQLLRDQNVYFSMSFREFALIDFNKKNLDGIIRFSPHYFNTLQELEKVVDILSS